MLDMPIEDLDLPMRAYNSLKRNNIVKVGQLLQLQDEDLLRMRNFGKKSLDEMKERLRMRGFLPPEEPSTSLRRRRRRGRPDEDERGRAEPWPTASTAASSAARPAPAWRCTRTSSCPCCATSRSRPPRRAPRRSAARSSSIITLAKEGTLASRRRIVAELPNEPLVIDKLINEIAPRYGDRTSGYTRVVKLGPRAGDAAPIVQLELV